MENILPITAVLFIFAIIITIHQMRPPQKLDWHGEPLVCISAGKIFDNERLYFCSKGVFICRNKELQIHFPFETLQSLEKSILKINNVRVWTIKFNKNGQHYSYEFRPRYSGFKRFYHYLQQNHPQITIKNWNWYWWFD